MSSFYAPQGPYSTTPHVEVEGIKGGKIKVKLRNFYLNEAKTEEEIEIAKMRWKYLDYSADKSESFASAIGGDLMTGTATIAAVYATDALMSFSNWITDGQYKSNIDKDKVVKRYFSYAKMIYARGKYETANGINACGKSIKQVQCMKSITKLSSELAQSTDSQSRNTRDAKSSDLKNDTFKAPSATLN